MHGASNISFVVDGNRSGFIAPALSVLFCFMLTFFTGCREARFESAWRDREIIVDALYNDWTGPLTYLDAPSMFIGFRNDDENIYILVKTVDIRSQTKVMRLGMTVRIEPPDHPKRTWSVHFPVGLEDHGIPLRGNEGPGRIKPEETASIHEMLGRMALLGPGDGERIETSPLQPSGVDYGIRAAIRDTSEVIVYELKFPMKGDEQRPYAAWTEPGGKLRLRFETGDIREWEDRKDPLQYDPNRDTTTGKLRDRGRDRERIRENERRLPPMMNPLAEPIQFQVQVSLAKNPGSPPNQRK